MNSIVLSRKFRRSDTKLFLERLVNLLFLWQDQFNLTTFLLNFGKMSVGIDSKYLRNIKAVHIKNLRGCVGLQFCWTRTWTICINCIFFGSVCCFWVNLVAANDFWRVIGVVWKDICWILAHLLDVVVHVFLRLSDSLIDLMYAIVQTVLKKKRQVRPKI